MTESDLTTKLTVLQTEFKMFREVHEVKEEERKQRVDAIFNCLSEIKKHLYSLPCKLHIERMKAMDGRINTQRWLVGLMLSAIVGSFVWMIRS